MNEESLFYHPYLNLFQLHHNEQDPKELRKPQQGGMGEGVKVQPARTLFPIQNSTKPTNWQRSNQLPAPHTRPVCICFPIGSVAAHDVQGEMGARVSTPHLNKAHISSPVSKSVPFPFSPELQFPLALETDICYFQSHSFLVRRSTAHMAQALQI